MRFAGRLTPRAGADQIVGVGPTGILVIRVRAAAHDGEANAALLRLLADHLDVPRTSVALAGGAASRAKVIEIDNVYDAHVRAAWPELTG